MSDERDPARTGVDPKVLASYKLGDYMTMDLSRIGSAESADPSVEAEPWTPGTPYAPEPDPASLEGKILALRRASRELNVDGKGND